MVNDKVCLSIERQLAKLEMNQVKVVTEKKRRRDLICLRREKVSVKLYTEWTINNTSREHTNLSEASSSLPAVESIEIVKELIQACLLKYNSETISSTNKTN